jgi:hypothetical protein
MESVREGRRYRFQLSSNSEAGLAYQIQLSGVPARLQDGMNWVDSAGRSFRYTRPALIVEDSQPLGRLGLEKQVTKLVVFVDDELQRVDAAQLFRYRLRPVLGIDQISEMHCEF